VDCFRELGLMAEFCDCVDAHNTIPEYPEQENYSVLKNKNCFTKSVVQERLQRKE
jgi:hypothetical protein